MTIYTRTGDAGTTGVIGGRLDKDHPRVEAYGTVDELNSLIGMAVHSLEQGRDTDMLADLADIQQHLFDCCSDLATLDQTRRPYRITPDHAAHLETRIDHYLAQTEEVDRFILPGGAPCSAALHGCRTVARRAERRVVSLERDSEQVNHAVSIYLNRLSDLFFVMARVGNTRCGIPDVVYARSKKVFKKRRTTPESQ